MQRNGRTNERTEEETKEGTNGHSGHSPYIVTEVYIRTHSEGHMLEMDC